VARLPAEGQIEFIIHWKGGKHSRLMTPRNRKGHHRHCTGRDVIEVVCAVYTRTEHAVHTIRYNYVQELDRYEIVRKTVHRLKETSAKGITVEEGADSFTVTCREQAMTVRSPIPGKEYFANIGVPADRVLYRLFMKMKPVIQNCVEADHREELERDYEGMVLKGMASSLEHSAYLSLEEIATPASRDKNIGAVGVEVTLQEGILTVTDTIEGAPAFRAGIRKGDRITRIDEEPVEHLRNIRAILAKLRGKLGSNVTLHILREEWLEPKEYHLTRKVTGILSHKTLGNGIGYIRFRWLDWVEEELDESIKALAAEGEIKGLILDLRKNRGGLLDQAVKATSKFLNDGVIVSIKGRGSRNNATYHAKGNRPPQDFPIVVLVDSKASCC
jgi:C-terminal peptidase prc